MEERQESGTSSRRQFLRRFAATVPVLAAGGAACRKSSGDAEKDSPYTYDLTDLKKVDPKWLKYEEQSPIALDRSPLGLAMHEGLIYVSDNRKISVFSSEDVRSGGFETEGAVKALSVSGNRIYAGMTDHIQTYALDGSRIKRWAPLDREAVITAVAVAGDKVYVADAGNKIIKQYDMEGNLLRNIGAKDNARDIPGFVVPSPYFDLAVDREERLWAVNPGRHRLENYAENGNIVSHWGESAWRVEGFCGCCNPTHIAIMPDGRTVTSEKGLPRVKVYDQMGKLQAVVAGPEQFEENTTGLDLAIDPAGRILVIDPNRKSIRIFTEKAN